MKALSVRQPWAWLIASGIKDVENRSWKTNFRGRVYIHAGAKFDMSALKDSRIKTVEYGGLVTVRQCYSIFWMSLEWKSGAIIGEVDIIDCVTESDSPWFSGPYGFVLANAVLYETPIACKGQLGLFDIGEGMETVYSRTFRDG